MIEAYSKNINVDANSAIPLNNVSLLKGCSTTQEGTSTIVLNKRGIYEVNVSAIVTSATAADVITIQLQKDGVSIPQAIGAFTVDTADNVGTIAFTTLIQVPQDNNCNCPCSIPTRISLLNAGDAATIQSIVISVVRV